MVSIVHLSFLLRESRARLKRASVDFSSDECIHCNLLLLPYAHELGLGAGCATSGDITIFDTMATTRPGGPCFWYYGPPDNIPTDTFSCATTPIIPDGCNFVLNTLSLVFDSSAYEQFGPLTSTLPGFVSTLKLDQIIAIANDLQIFTKTYADKLDNTATLFPVLQYVQGIVSITDSAGYKLPDLPLAFPQLQVAYGLNVVGTAFTGLYSFPGLQCLAAFLFVSDNDQLSTLEGINTPPGLVGLGGYDCLGLSPLLTLENNPLLVGPGVLDPLNAAICPPPGSFCDPPVDLPVSVSMAPCATTAAQLCTYVTNGSQC